MIQDEILFQENNQGGVNITSAVTKYQGRNLNHYLKRVRLTKLCASALFWADLRENYRTHRSMILGKLPT